MNSKKCPICGSECKVQELKIKAFIEEKYVGEYAQQYSICQNCFTRVFDSELDLKNAESKNEFWREHYKLLSLSEIRKIPRKYGISRDLCAKILFIEPKGALRNRTIWDGELPSSEENKRLSMALENPKYFYECAKCVVGDDDILERIRKRIG